jgi:hypothetical protein
VLVVAFVKKPLFPARHFLLKYWMSQFHARKKNSAREASAVSLPFATADRMAPAGLGQCGQCGQ